MKGMIDMKKSKDFFLHSYFFLSHIMALDMRQKLQKLWVFLLTTGLKLERD